MTNDHYPSSVIPTDVPVWTNRTWTNGPVGLATNGTISELLPSANNSSSATGPSMLFRFICETGIAMPIAVLGILGNILAVIVLYKQNRRHQSTTFLLQCLAVTDSTVLLSTLVLRSLRYWYYFTRGGWLSGYIAVYHYIFRWLYPLVYFFRLTDTWLTVLLTIDRLIAVKYPLHAQSICTRKRAWKHLLLLVTTAFLFSLPRFLEYKIDTQESHGFVSTELSQNKGYTIGYKIIIFFLVMYLIPMLLLIVLNAKLVGTLKKADLHRASLADRPNSRRVMNRGISVIVVTVVLAAIICNVSAMMSHLMYSLEICFVSIPTLEIPRRYLSLISNIFVTTNSAINFVIYCFCSRNFRTVLYRMCRCYADRGRLVRDTSRTRTMGTYISLTTTSMVRKKSSSPITIPYLPNKLYG